MISHCVTTKYAKHDMFDAKYLPQDTNTKFIFNRANFLPTFEMDPDSTIFKKQSDLLHIIKSKCLSSIKQISMEVTLKLLLTRIWNIYLKQILCFEMAI